METEERPVMKWMVMRCRIERNEGWRGGEEGGREVMRRITERKEGER